MYMHLLSAFLLRIRDTVWNVECDRWNVECESWNVVLGAAEVT